MKKLVSLLLALAMALSMGAAVFAADGELLLTTAAPADTIAAAPAAFTVYTQDGTSGVKTVAKEYTAEEFAALAQTNADGYGYQYFKKDTEQAVVATEYVTLDDILADAGVSFEKDYVIKFTCTDGEYKKFSASYADVQARKYFFNNGKAEEVPAAFAISWTNGNLADGTVADYAKKAYNSGSVRFVIGTTEEEYAASAAAGNRMPSGVIAITIVDDTPEFTDVASDYWARAAISYVYKKGFFTGVGEGMFAPNDTISMSEAVVALYKVAGKTYVSAGDNWYSIQLAWAENCGIIEADEFVAANGLSREMFVNMLYKTLAYKYDTTVTDAMKETLAKAEDYADIAPKYADAMAWAVNAGLIAGTETDTLKVAPKAEISRAEVCSILKTFYTTIAK